MALPKRKLDLEIYSKKENLDRRVEMNQEITKSDVFLPDGILHDDLDLGMLEYIKENFVIVSSGEKIPVIDKILTIQKWGEYTTNWKFTDKDNNLKIPFISVIRKPDAQPGTNPVIQRTIPDRKKFFYSTVSTWDGNQQNREIYKIPQPVAVDITYEVVIVCSTIRDLNRFNKVVLQKFTSRQSYTIIKGHYIPIVLEGIDDNTPIDAIDGRRFYLQTYKFVMLGFLLDPEEFTVSPAISRVLLMTEYSDIKSTTKCISDSAEIYTKIFRSDGENTLYTVDGNIGILLNVVVNGVNKKIDVDFYHIIGSPRINLNNIVPEGQPIEITYFRGKENVMTDCNNNVLNIGDQTLVIDDTCSYHMSLQHTINVLLSVSINGKILDKDIDYSVIPPKDIVLNYDLNDGDVVNVKYIY